MAHARGESPVTNALEKLTVLSVGGELAAPIRRTLEQVAELPYVESVLALPDVHWKEDMEVPSSIAITTRDMIVPEFTSMDVNDGMGVVRTGLQADEMSPERLAAFFASVNANSATHHFDVNRYSISAGELRRTLTEGARALLSRYDLGAQVLERFEDGGCTPMDGLGTPTLTDVVPLQLLHTTFTRSEMGLNFGGNHFLEVQVVDELVDREVAARWGFERGEVVVRATRRVHDQQRAGRRHHACRDLPDERHAAHQSGQQDGMDGGHRPFADQHVAGIDDGGPEPQGQAGRVDPTGQRPGEHAEDAEGRQRQRPEEAGSGRFPPPRGMGGVPPTTAA